MKRSTLLLALFCLLGFATVNAQNQELSLIPEQPLEGQPVFLVIHSIWTSGGCELQSASVNVDSLPVITVDANYSVGVLTVICEAVDTISLGILPPSQEISPGVFELYQINTTLTSIQTPGFSSSDTLFFFVQPSPSAIVPLNQQYTLQNLGNGNYVLQFNEATPNQSGQLIDSQGRKIRKIQNLGNQLSIDLSAENEGIYYLISSNWSLRFLHKR